MTTQDASPQHQAHDERASTAGAAPVVAVAYDGSPAATTALTWAARDAGSRGARLRVLMAADVGPGDTGGAAALAEAGREAGVKLTREGAEWAATVEGGPPAESIETDVRIGDPTAALVEASREADLLVIGNRGRGAVTGALLGSTAFSVTARAACPVVVVRGDTELRVGVSHPVVVGVDSSESALAAVAWAADEAATSGAPLVLIAAWTPPDTLAASYGTSHLPEMLRRAEAHARHGADVALARAHQDHPDLRGEVRLVREKPAKALVAASQDAGLVVVGARGLSSVGGLFLGSVSHATIHRAACPVAVVREAAHR